MEHGYGSSKKITLVTSGKALIDFPQFKPKFQDKLAKQLESKGVELIFQDKVLGFPDGISPGKWACQTLAQKRRQP